MSYLHPPAFLSVISVRLHPEGIQSGLSSIETVWSDLFPGYTFNYTFVDETLRNIYAADARFRTIVIIFTSISIILATMGVFGLAAYSMFKQQKAIGIRKVLGASMARILLHLTQEFYLVVLAGLLIGSLMAYFSIQPWLNQFAYHITITPVVFLIAGLVMLFVVSLAVGVHAIKYSLTNPVDTLRYE